MGTAVASGEMECSPKTTSSLRAASCTAGSPGAAGKASAIRACTWAGMDTARALASSTTFWAAAASRRGEPGERQRPQNAAQEKDERASHHGGRSIPSGTGAGYGREHLLGQRGKGFRAGSLGLGRHRRPGVAPLPDHRIEGDLAQEGNAQPLGGPAAAAVTEDVAALPQWGQAKVLMFSTMPRMGTSTLRNMATALMASASATSCGVVTITAPASRIFCDRVSCASPVPGGRSTTRTSSAPQATSPRSCVALSSPWDRARSRRSPSPRESPAT